MKTIKVRIPNEICERIADFVQVEIKRDRDQIEYKKYKDEKNQKKIDSNQQNDL